MLYLFRYFWSHQDFLSERIFQADFFVHGSAKKENKTLAADITAINNNSLVFPARCPRAMVVFHYSLHCSARRRFSFDMLVEICCIPRSYTALARSEDFCMASSSADCTIVPGVEQT